jgi:hypothetical protein
MASKHPQSAVEAEHTSMLPGLRFLFVAIVLSTSVLIFGLGAAALLRAAHQEFASLPSRPAPREPVFPSQNDSTIPALAMLRVDAPSTDDETLKPPATDNVQAAAAPGSSPIVATAEQPAEPENVALPETPPPEAQNPAEVPLSAIAANAEPPAIAEASPTPEAPSVPEAPAAEAPTISEAPKISEAPTISEAPSVEATLATTETVAPPPENQPAPEQTSAVTPTIDGVETKIATLGDPAVEIETQASPIKARQKSRASAVRKRLKAERAIKRRKMAQRARVLRRASQAPADPFGAQPFGGFPGTSRTQ